MGRKQLDANGNISDQYAINEEFYAMLDFYVAGSLSARADDVRELAEFYKERVELYKLMDGKEGRRNWREDLTKALQEFIEAFPDAAGKKRKRGAEMVPSDEAEKRQKALAQL